MTNLAVRRSLLPTAFAVLTLAASACAQLRPQMGELPTTGPRTRDTLLAQPRIATSTARETVEKRVDVKRAPRTLVAADASTCTVSEEQFAETRIGDYARCAWGAR